MQLYNQVGKRCTMISKEISVTLLNIVALKAGPVINDYT